jgi:hypothetical protein
LSEKDSVPGWKLGGKVKMNRFSRTLLIAALAAFMGLAGAFSADSAYYTAGQYRFNYTTTAQLNMAKDIGKYASYCKAAALLSVGGRQGYTGPIDVYMEYNSGSWIGSYTWGSTAIKLNVKYNYLYTTGAKWGSVLAHETSHLFFYRYIGAATWNANTNILYYRTFLTESLAWYAGDVAYAYGPRYSAATIKANLKYYTKQQLGSSFVTFYGTGYYYRNGGYFNTITWQLRAQGYFFVHQLGAYSRLTTLMDTLRIYSMYSGKYIRSSTYTTARSYFENAFKAAYGKLANCGLIYESTGKNTNYLMGVFWYNWIR